MNNDDIWFALFIFVLFILALTKILGMPLFVIFLVLRLCGVIDWHWAIVCVPLMVWTLWETVELIAKLKDGGD